MKRFVRAFLIVLALVWGSEAFSQMGKEVDSAPGGERPSSPATFQEALEELMGPPVEKLPRAPDASVSIQISSPSPGERIETSWALVEGTLSNPMKREIAVTANGAPAFIWKDRFVAHHVPLQPGSHTVTVCAVTRDERLAATASVAIEAEPPPHTFMAAPSQAVGAPPLETSLLVAGDFDFGELSIAPKTKDAVEIQSTDDPKEFRVRIPSEGIFQVSAEVMDLEGRPYRDTAVFQVTPAGDLDTQLKAIWEELRNALNTRDIDRALLLFDRWSREDHRALFTRLGDRLPKIAQGMREIELVRLESDSAEYKTKKDEEHAGTPFEITHTVRFRLDRYGFRRILGL